MSKVNVRPKAPIFNTMSPLETFYEKLEEPNRSCLLALREIILNAHEHLNETMKYGLPFFCYKKKIFCYFWFDKKTKQPYIGFMEGRNMEHPELIKGNRKRVKVLAIQPEEDLDMETLDTILQLALDLY